MKTLLAGLFGVLLAATSLRAVEDPPKDGPRGATPGVRDREQSGPSDEEKAIREMIDAFSRALREGDARATAEMFTEDGEAVDAEGGTILGREALREHYTARFASGPGDKIETTVDSIKFLAPGVAREAGRTTVSPSAGGLPVTGGYTAIHVKRDGRWLVASIRDLPDKELSHYERLKELEWLVGDWVEETEDAVVFTSVAWTEDKSFLLRSFDVRIKGKPSLSGTQRIGWDPLTKQIKSWVFDARGGYGEGLWMRSENQWVIKATGVRPDGRTTTATQVLTYVNNDTLRWKSIDRTLGGEIVHQIDEVTMVRKPPQPK